MAEQNRGAAGRLLAASGNDARRARVAPRKTYVSPPEDEADWNTVIWDAIQSAAAEAAGAFERYGRRSGAQRDASLALMSQAADPNTDPLTGAGMKALGLAGLVTHPLAFFPTREEWDQRLQAAGNDSRIGRSIGGFLSDLPSLIDPQMAAGGAALATAPLLGKMVNKVNDAADVGRASVMNKSEFEDMARRGQLRQARTEQQDFNDLIAGKMPANKFELQDSSLFGEDYEMGDFTQRLREAGLHVDDDMYGNVIAGRDEAAVDALKAAKTPMQFGRSFGYSEEDIARFYLERNGGDVDAALQEYIRDMSNK